MCCLCGSLGRGCAICGSMELWIVGACLKHRVMVRVVENAPLHVFRCGRDRATTHITYYNKVSYNLIEYIILNII